MPALTLDADCVIVCTSVHHGNTRRVADAIGSVTRAAVLEPGPEANDAVRSGAQLGFGSGIFFGSHHRNLVRFVESLPALQARAVFLFSTSGTGYRFPRAFGLDYHRRLRRALLCKGYTVIGEFACKGFDTYGPWGRLGGVARGHPDDDDLANTRAFATGLVASGKLTRCLEP
jgi:flavodoxin